MAKKKTKSKKPEPSGMSPALWLVPILAVLDLLLYISFSMRWIEPFMFSMTIWKMGTIGFQLILIGTLVTSHALDRRAAAPLDDDEDEDDEVYEVKAEVVDVKAEVVEETPKAAVKAPAAAAETGVEKAPDFKPSAASGLTIIEYPKKESGGIYADTLIPIGGGNALKLRTKMARACLLCDEQEKCWALVRHDVDIEDFKTNIECKDGLGVGSL
jgi:hypothetical protein